MANQKIIGAPNLAEEGLIRVKQLAELLSVNRSTVYRWIEDDVLPKPFKIGATAVWRLGTIKEWLDKYAPVVHHERRIITNS
jgi:excisionase family DNA binding protein